MRDDFSEKTKLTLALRVNSKCSNPDCERPTSGPAQDNNKSVNIGVAAHICAASEGGPRYDPEMTSEERKNINNGIWLCVECSNIIDKDSKSYPKEMLYRWKEKAEEKAKRDLANRKTVNYREIIEEDKKIIRVFILSFEDEDTIRLLNHDFHGKYPRVWHRPLDELSDFYILPSSNLEHRVLRELAKRLMKSVNELLFLLHFKGFTSNDWINDDTYCIADEDDMVLCNCVCTGIWKEYKNLIKTYKEILYKLETHD